MGAARHHLQLAGEQPKDLRLTWDIDQAARAAREEEIFGKRVLITDHDDWPVAEVIAGYRSQSGAEFSFRQMKDPRAVSFSPMSHWTEHNIRVHTFTCVLALQIAHLLRLQAERAGLHTSVRELLTQLAGIGETVLAEVTTDRAAVYPRVIDELIPSALHTVEAYANNPVEADHGRLKARLRPMRGLKRHRSARILNVGHAFVRNLRRGHYDIATDVPACYRLRTAFDDLATTI